MHEVAPQAALHRPVGGYWRVDAGSAQAPHEQHEPPALLGVRDALREREQLLLVDLQVNLELRVRQVDVEAELVLDGAPDHHRELARCECPALVTAPGTDGKRRALMAPEQIDRDGAGGLGGLLDDEGGMQEVDTEHIARPLGELANRGSGEHGQDAATLAELERAEIAQQSLDVAAQLRVEEHAIASFQHDLTELHEDARLGARLRTKP